MRASTAHRSTTWSVYLHSGASKTFSLWPFTGESRDSRFRAKRGNERVLERASSWVRWFTTTFTAHSLSIARL